jgi:hypothetical protein
MGDLEEGWNCVTQAFTIGQRSKETWFKPELECVKGDILLDRGDRAEAEACYREAFRTACDLKTPFFELRAVMRLARLAGSTAQRAKALAQLAESYRKFDQGFETPDLVEARQLLGRLDGGVRAPATAQRAQVTPNQAYGAPRKS